ncbi:hypothetical protein DFS33DRAFT_811213 [Desarmillaria ectypa]|nr:hypothetical protein DFS33DRAFT_811213 [Desarmillaria ectypa]
MNLRAASATSSSCHLSGRMVKNYIHLRIALVDKIKSDPDYSRLANSLSVNDEFYGMKLAILNSRTKELDMNTLHSKIRLGEDYPAHAKMAFLHFAASTGDLLAAHEVIYLGSNIDVPDFEGYTPLHVAVHTIRTAQFNKSSPLKHACASRRRIVKVIRLLLEHHADVNLVLEGQCPLTHACMIKDWELIELFAEYGANPAPPESYVPPSSFLLKPDSISRFNAKFEHYAANPFVRGPRPCPCFSGLPLAECHAKEDKAYSPDLICFCTSEKRFGVCCSRRNVFAYEQWNESR